MFVEDDVSGRILIARIVDDAVVARRNDHHLHGTVHNPFMVLDNETIGQQIRFKRKYRRGHDESERA